MAQQPDAPQAGCVVAGCSYSATAGSSYCTLHVVKWGREASPLPHPADCPCAIPCRTCGHESEQHAGSMWFGTGPRRCRAEGLQVSGVLHRLDARPLQAGSRSATSREGALCAVGPRRRAAR